jgi:hypothetical protein
MSLRRADHLSRGELPSVMCLGVIVKPEQLGGQGPLVDLKPCEGGGELVSLNIITR